MKTVKAWALLIDGKVKRGIGTGRLSVFSSPGKAREFASWSNADDLKVVRVEIRELKPKSRRKSA